jgi:hypothetical protein
VRCAWAPGPAHFDGAAATEAVLAILDRCIDRMDRAPATSLPIEQAPPQNED